MKQIICWEIIIKQFLQFAVLPKLAPLIFSSGYCSATSQRGALKRALLIIPVASMYRSTHLEMQLLSLPLKLEPGFVIHFSKHFPLTVCVINDKYQSKNDN